MDPLDDDSKEVLDRLQCVREHGNGNLAIEVRDRDVVFIKETFERRKGKEYGVKTVKR